MNIIIICHVFSKNMAEVFSTSTARGGNNQIISVHQKVQVFFTRILIPTHLRVVELLFKELLVAHAVLPPQVQNQRLAHLPEWAFGL